MNKRGTPAGGILCPMSYQLLYPLCPLFWLNISRVQPHGPGGCLFNSVSISLDPGWLHLCGGPRWEDHVHLRDSLSPPGSFSGRWVVHTSSLPCLHWELETHRKGPGAFPKLLYVHFWDWKHLSWQVCISLFLYFPILTPYSATF